jgi:YHS domain-containing protein
MLRLALFLVFAIFAARGFWRLVDGIIEGATGPRPGGRAPQRGVSMARDPVCGMFVLPERAVTLLEGRSRLFFCSNACRDKYRARPGAGSTSEPAEGRTA